MQNVKQYVNGSGNSSLRGFFSSDSVDFDPPSLSLRQNIMKAKAKVIYDLASGFTPASEEREIRDLMKNSENSYELIRMVGAIGGWEGLDDELEYGQVDDVAKQLAQVLDQRDYVVYKLIRRYLILLDYDASPNSPNLGDCFMRLLLWPKEFQAAEFDWLLFPSRKAKLLEGIASATMRGRDNMVNAARILPDPVIRQYTTATPTPYRSTELIALMHEANYTTLICSSLVKLDYKPLYRVIADMVDPGLTDLQRIACKDTCRDTLRLEFAAAAKAVEVVGSNEAKATVNRFMGTLKAALDNFSPTLPAPTAVGAIIAALGQAGDTLSQLLKTITELPAALTNAITISNIFGADRDDKARELINELASQGSLARLAFTIKLEMVNWLLSSSGLLTIDVTTDDEEIAINKVMQAAKDYDKAELYQLAAAATWDSLDSNIQGDEFDELLNILQQPV
jgi:hypothetical protein